MKTLVWKSQDNLSEVTVDDATNRATLVLGDSTPYAIAVTGGSGTATVVFSTASVATEVATALAAAKALLRV